MRVGYAIYDSHGGQTYAGVPDRLGLSYKDLTRAITENTGNLAFKFGARRLFSDDVVYFNYSDDPAEIREKVDVIVLAEANLVNPGVDYGRPARFVREVDRPVFLCGVGAQAGMTTTPEDFPAIPDGTMSFLSEVAQRTDRIFVRGEFTANVLKKFGITNVTTAGCPSLLISPNPNLWQGIGAEANRARLLERPTVTEGVYPVSQRTPESDATERFLFQLVRFLDADFVAQSQISVRKIGLGYSDEASADDLGHTARYLAPGADTRAIVRLLGERSRAFARVDEWVSYMRTRTSIIGTRIHGNMMGIQAGIPSMPVVHDSRTKELCETMGIPYTNVEEIAKLRAPEELNTIFKRLFEADLAALDARRRDIAGEYVRSMSAVGLTPSDHLSTLAA